MRASWHVNMMEAAMALPDDIILETLRSRLSAADSMLDQGLKSIHAGHRLDAMETVYAVSCLIEEMVSCLDSAGSVESRTPR